MEEPNENENENCNRSQPAPKAKKSLWNKPLTDSEIQQMINLSDPGSELEEEEGLDDDWDEDVRPIQFSTLRSYRAQEKELFDEMPDDPGVEVQIERLDEGSMNECVNVQNVEIDIIDEMPDEPGVEVQIERLNEGSMNECMNVQNVEIDIVDEMPDEPGVEAQIERHDEGSMNEIDAIDEMNVNDRPNERIENRRVEDHRHLDQMFQWDADYARFTAQKEIYMREPGPTIFSTCPYELFTAVWNDDIMLEIVNQTKTYAWQKVAPRTANEAANPDFSRQSQWDETNVNEMLTFFSMLIYMSLDYRVRLDEYWSTGILEMPKRRAIMSRDRFLLLLKFLHFKNNQEPTTAATSYEKKVDKISKIVDHCNTKFQEYYVPKQFLSLDESLLLWKGRLSWVQCIRTKAARFGIKSFELCEGDTGYLLVMFLFAGKNSSGTESSIYGFKNTTAKVVLKLMDNYLDVGHILVMDNWYNQLSLTRFLKSRNTDVIGTLNRRRENVPNDIKILKESLMIRGDMVARHSGDVSVVSWKDVKLVTFISTYHNNATYVGRRAGQSCVKPIVVQDYNANMGGVDLKDQRLSAYPMERKRATKWYLKVFRRLINITLQNTFLIYMANHAKGAQPQPRRITHRQFRYAVADLLVRKHKQDYVPPLVGVQRPTIVHRLDGRHHNLVKNKLAERQSNDGSLRLQRRRCVRCSARQIKRIVTTGCQQCDVGLCVQRCFQEYRTLENLE